MDTIAAIAVQYTGTSESRLELKNFVSQFWSVFGEDAKVTTPVVKTSEAFGRPLVGGAAGREVVISTADGREYRLRAGEVLAFDVDDESIVWVSDDSAFVERFTPDVFMEPSDWITFHKVTD